MNSLDIRTLFASSSLSGQRATGALPTSADAAKIAFEDADAMLEQAGLTPDYIAIEVENAKIDLLETMLKSFKLLEARYVQMGESVRYAASAKGVRDCINAVSNQLLQLREEA